MNETNNTTYLNAVLVDHWEKDEKLNTMMVDTNGWVWYHDWQSISAIQTRYVLDIDNKTTRRYKTEKRARYKNKFIVYYTFGFDDIDKIERKYYQQYVRGKTHDYLDLWFLYCKYNLSKNNDTLEKFSRNAENAIITWQLRG